MFANSDQHSARALPDSDEISVFSLKLLLPAVATAFLLGGCNEKPIAAPDANATPASFLPIPATADSDCGDQGSFDAALFGAIETEVRWRGAELECLSMPRPDSDGVRLRFSGNVGDERLAVIVALPGFESGQSAAELPSNITVSVDGSGRFFSTPDLNACFAEIDSDDENRVTAAVFCVAPLGELNGDGAVTVAELRFSSVVNWGES